MNTKSHMRDQHWEKFELICPTLRRKNISVVAIFEFAKIYQTWGDITFLKCRTYLPYLLLKLTKSMAASHNFYYIFSHVQAGGRKPQARCLRV